MMFMREACRPKLNNSMRSSRQIILGAQPFQGSLSMFLLTTKPCSKPACCTSHMHLSLSVYQNVIKRYFISSFSFFFFKNSSIWIYFRILAILFKDACQTSNVSYGFHLVQWVLIQIRCWFVTPRSIVSPWFYHVLQARHYYR